MLEDAREVFLSANRFVVVPEGEGGRVAIRDVVSRSPERMPAATFLTQVVPRDGLRHLRFLELVFPPFQTPWMLAHEPVYRQWLESIEIARDHLTLPALTVRVHFADRLSHDVPSSSTFRATMTKEQALEIYMSYARVVMPLKGLKGLGKLFVHVAWPWEWTERGRWRRMEQRGAVEREVLSMERRLEKMVMGEGYESQRIGKEEVGMSQWMDDSLGPYV